MGNKNFKSIKYKTVSDKIPLPNTVTDIDPNNYYKLAVDKSVGLTDNKLLSIASVLYKNGIRDFDPFRIVSLQSLIDSGLCISLPTWLGGNIFVYRLIFSDDLQYLPVGDVVINAFTNINSRNLLSSNPYPLYIDGMAWVNSVFELDCKNPPFVDLSNAVIDSSSIYQNNNTWDKINPVSYNKPVSPPYISNPENNPWWSVELPDDIKINQIDVFNRDDVYFENLAGAIITIKNKNGNIVYTQNFSKRISLLYVFTPTTATTPYVTGNQIIISRPGTNNQLVIGKIIINKNFKHLGWYSDNQDRTLSNVTPAKGYLDTINNFKTKQKIVAQQNSSHYLLGEQCINNLNNKIDYNKLDSATNAFNRNGNMKFDNIPVLLVKNDSDYSKVIPNDIWKASAISYEWGELVGNWGCLEVRGNVYSDCINFGTVFCVGRRRAAWAINGNPVVPQSNLSGDQFGQLMNTRVYCAIKPTYVVCLSDLHPNEINYNNNVNNWINNRSVGGNIRSTSDAWPAVFTYTSPFGTFSALNADDNRQLGGGPWKQNYKYYDIRPDILNLFCCSALGGDSKNILKRDLELNNFDLTTYCATTKYGSNKCDEIINTKCVNPEDIKKEYKDRSSQQMYSPCKQIFLKNQGGVWDDLAKIYANSYPDDKFSSCIKPKIPDDTIPDIIKQVLINNPKCVDIDCNTNGYKTRTMANTSCEINYVNCITTINSDIGTATGNKITMNNNPDCSISPNSTNVIPVNCEYSNWSECKNNIQTRTILNSARNGGILCDSTKLTQSCTTTNPPTPNPPTPTPNPTNIDCEYSNWGSCVNGTQSRTITTQATGTGTPCDTTTLTQTCTTPTNINCAYSDWDTCIDGKQSRTITTQASGTGTPCGNLTQSCVDINNLTDNQKNILYILLGIVVFLLFLLIIFALLK